ncbi:MAG TPA: hypothetical protein VL899_01720 [Alphaproteobacteria bacterium]|nr:hypothetical protein [Alphaproteobacteria bacterium]
MAALVVVISAFLGTLVLTVRRGTRGAVEGLGISIALCVFAALLQAETSPREMTLNGIIFGALVHASATIPAAILAIPIGLAAAWIKNRAFRGNSR